MPKITMSTDLDTAIAFRRMSLIKEQKQRDKEYLKEKRAGFNQKVRDLRKLVKLGLLPEGDVLSHLEYGFSKNVERTDLPLWRKAGKLSIHYKSGGQRPCEEFPHGTITVTLKIEGFSAHTTINYEKPLTGMEKCKYVETTHTSVNLVCQKK